MWVLSTVLPRRTHSRHWALAIQYCLVCCGIGFVRLVFHLDSGPEGVASSWLDAEFYLPKGCLSPNVWLTLDHFHHLASRMVLFFLALWLQAIHGPTNVNLATVSIPFKSFRHHDPFDYGLCQTDCVRMFVYQRWYARNRQLSQL